MQIASWEKLAMVGLVAASQRKIGTPVDYFRVVRAVGVPADEAEPTLIALLSRRLLELDHDGETVWVTLAGMTAVATARPTIDVRAPPE